MKIKKNHMIEQLPWPDNYYEPQSGKDRKLLLDKAMEEENEANRIRYALWEARYGKVAKNNGKPGTDGFMKLWMDLEYASGRISSIFGIKKIGKELRRDIKNLECSDIEQYGELGQELLFMEMVQGARYYFELCAEDRNYNTEAFGLVPITEERFKNKIAADVYRICFETPKVYGVEQELALFTKGVMEALKIDFPEQWSNLVATIEKE